MKRSAMIVAFAVASGLGLLGRAEAKEPAVQIALLLDTSNSMDGLINQAKSQLWSVVNQFIHAKRDGRPASIEVALYEYGNDNLSPEEGFVRLVVPLTDDLDSVSERLFALKTRGGSEFCGQVIRDATVQLTWSRSSRVYKAIFIAGNEPFSQGSVPYQSACRSAINKGIIVNTIFCGTSSEGEQTGWSAGAALAEGRYLSIDHNQRVVAIPCPQDDEITQLGLELNKTYIPYGKLGHAGQARQTAQDANASSLSPSALASRAVAKSSLNVYCNDTWDLIDAIKTGKCKLDELIDDDLPQELRKLSKSERLACIHEKTAQRDSVQKRILILHREREAFLAAVRKQQAAANEETLDTAILKAVREQANRANIQFD